jgi:hypothetical protein
VQEAELVEEINMVNTGSLIVFVLGAGGALPISGARVTIYNAGDLGGEPVAQLISGENGKTEVIYLPTPQVPLTDLPERRPGIFALYDILVELEGYYNVISRNIPVYPQVLSIQPIYMVPMTRIAQPNSIYMFPGGI